MLLSRSGTVSQGRSIRTTIITVYEGSQHADRAGGRLGVQGQVLRAARQSRGQGQGSRYCNTALALMQGQRE